MYACMNNIIIFVELCIHALLSLHSYIICICVLYSYCLYHWFAAVCRQYWYVSQCVQVYIIIIAAILLLDLIYYILST